MDLFNTAELVNEEAIAELSIEDLRKILEILTKAGL
jgi:hypothetical protein